MTKNKKLYQPLFAIAIVILFALLFLSNTVFAQQNRNDSRMVGISSAHESKYMHAGLFNIFNNARDQVVLKRNMKQ